MFFIRKITKLTNASTIIWLFIKFEKLFLKKVINGPIRPLAGRIGFKNRLWFGFLEFVYVRIEIVHDEPQTVVFALEPEKINKIPENPQNLRKSAKFQKIHQVSENPQSGQKWKIPQNETLVWAT